jgi:hypothetical protein
MSIDCPSQLKAYPPAQTVTDEDEFVMSEYFNGTYCAKSRDSMENDESIMNVAKYNTIVPKKSPTGVNQKPNNKTTYNNKYVYMVSTF